MTTPSGVVILFKLENGGNNVYERTIRIHIRPDW